MRDHGLAGDVLLAEASRARKHGDLIVIEGFVLCEWFDEDGVKFHESAQKNLITSYGDSWYIGRAALSSGQPAAATGMKLGTGSTAVAKTGAGAALVTYLSGSNKAFDATFPSVAANVATYKRTYAAGEATSAGTNITEAVVVNDTIATDATSAVGATISRVLLASPAPKAAGDSLAVTWTHTFTGA
jgi:hypothetical protein